MHYVRPGVTIFKKSKDFASTVTTLPIPAGDLVLVWGGKILTYDQAQALPPLQRRYTMQIADELFICTAQGTKGAPDFVNHSCDPNCGLEGQIALRAMRDIRAGEEITCDYAISESTDMHEFDCSCGTSQCRGRFTGDDWRLPEVQERYRGWMSPYLARRIDAGSR